LGNGKYAVELADRWEARTPYADKTAPRPYIDIKIPELNGSAGGKIKIRWYSNDWHYIGIDKSADGVNFTNVWGRAAHYTFDEVYIIDLDPNCIYYRIHFEDGNLDYEVTGVYKDVEVEIYTAPAPPSPPPQPPSVSITKVAIWESPTGKEVTSVNATDDLIKYWLVVYYNSTGIGTCTLTITVGGKTAWSGDVKIQSGSGYWGVPFTWLASGTIADLMVKYGISGNQLTLCADISTEQYPISIVMPSLQLNFDCSTLREINFPFAVSCTGSSLKVGNDATWALGTTATVTTFATHSV
jgi:hypothetical protein